MLHVARRRLRAPPWRCVVQRRRLRRRGGHRNAALHFVLPQSKVITTQTKVKSIPPRQTYEFKLEFAPRRINPEYIKEITVVNTR